MPGWPPANESVVTPVELSRKRLSCAHVPLPAVPDMPIVLWCESQLRISIPYTWPCASGWPWRALGPEPGYTPESPL